LEHWFVAWPLASSSQTSNNQPAFLHISAAILISFLPGVLPKEESPILSGSMQCADATIMSVQTVQVPPASLLLPSSTSTPSSTSIQKLSSVIFFTPVSPQVNFSVSSLSASNLTVDNLSVKNVEYSKVDRFVSVSTSRDA
jgi:hypothetical protein